MNDAPSSRAPADTERAKAELRDMEERKDIAYMERNQVVAALAKLFPSGIARTDIPGWSPDWHGCVYIDLPTGQVSWHYHDSQSSLFASLPPYHSTWDGHDTAEKYRRVAALSQLDREAAQKKFLTAVENPAPPTDHLLEMVRQYGSNDAVDLASVLAECQKRLAEAVKELSEYEAIVEDAFNTAATYCPETNQAGPALRAVKDIIDRARHPTATGEKGRE